MAAPKAAALPLGDSPSRRRGIVNQTADFSFRGFEELPPPVHPIRCAPCVLVLLGAPQKVERRGAVADGLFNGVGDEDRADALFLEVGIVAAEVVVDDAVEREA